MKVLFALNNNNDKILENVIKRYQKNYKEILAYKSVYYFKAIVKELQKDKGYDKIIISEDLEPFANNNYAMIDKFLLDNFKSITETLKDNEIKNADIIVLCADRRKIADDMLAKLFNLGVYNAIIGQDRSIDTICQLINTPKTRQEAKQYYRIKTDDMEELTEDDNSVSEVEVQNILAHYKRLEKLGKGQDEYVQSFNNIVPQYNDAQLRIIIRYLPLSVKAVLEEKSTKYQELITFSTQATNKNKVGKIIPTSNKVDEAKTEEKQKSVNSVKTFEIGKKEKLTKPIVIPSTIKKTEVKKLEEDSEESIELDGELEETIQDVPQEIVEEKVDSLESNETTKIEEENSNGKKGRGRPRKYPLKLEESKVKRGRGRPKKIQEEDFEDTDLFNLDDETTISSEKKENEEIDLLNSDLTENKEELDLFNSDEAEDKEEIDLFNMDKSENKDDEMDLFDSDDIEDKEEDVGLFDTEVEEENTDDDVELFDSDDDENEIDLFNPEEEVEEDDTELFSSEEAEDEEDNSFVQGLAPTETKITATNLNISNLLTKEKKLVTFVGTTKSGTSFVVNNVAELLATMGINTAILDMTKNRNSYYIYTNNDDKLRNIAADCIEKLENEKAEGIVASQNLTVYVDMPGDSKKYSSNINKVLETLVKNYSLVIVDCDFDSPLECFENAQEIYLVQSMDVLTIQPLTAFLRNLKAKGVLDSERLRVVINKSLKVKNLSDRVLIGGLAFYNDPSMSFMTELFNKDRIKYCVIPFDMQNYAKYLEVLVNCEMSLNGYTKDLISSLKELGNMVYPLLNRQTYSPRGNQYKDNFSSDVNETLSKMKKTYQ